MTIKTRAGEILNVEVHHEPMTGPELDRKFDALVLPRFGEDKSARVAKLLKSLAAAASVKPFMAGLEG